MGLVDAFSAEDRVNVRFSDFYNLIKGCTQREMLMNGINCNVPYQSMREMMTGIKEPDALKEGCECDGYADESALASAT